MRNTWPKLTRNNGEREMKDIFEKPQLVFWSHRFNNFMIYTRPTFGMFATVEGSNNRKLCVSESHFEKEFELELIGEL